MEKDPANGMTRSARADVWRLVGLGFLLSHSLRSRWMRLGRVGCAPGERGRKPTMKYTTDRPFADPDKAARRLMQHALAFEPVQDGHIYIELHPNAPFLFGDKGTPAEYAAGLDRAIGLGWLDITIAERS